MALSKLELGLWGAGTGLNLLGDLFSGVQNRKLQKQQLALDREKLDWQKGVDLWNQENAKRQLGTGSLDRMRKNFRENLYGALSQG